MTSKTFALILATALALPPGSVATAVRADYCGDLCSDLPVRSLTYDGSRDDCERELEEADYRCDTAVVPYPSAPRRAEPGRSAVGRRSYAPSIPDAGFFDLY
jgi:hypothetical protein